MGILKSGGLAVIAAAAALASCKADLAHSNLDGGGGKQASGGTNGRGGAAASGGTVGTGGTVVMTGGTSGRPDAGTTGSGGTLAASGGNTGSAGTMGAGGAGRGGAAGTGGSVGTGGAAGTGGSGAGGVDAGTGCGEGTALCSNACVDILNSPAHCGTCTNTCSDGCSAGHCYKTLVQKTNTGAVSSFAVNEGNLYYLDRESGELSRIPRGGGAPTVIATGQYYGGALALDSDTLFWLDEGNVSATGGVIKMALSGGPYTEFVTGEPNPMVIALDATNVYWSDYRPHFVKKVPKQGGDVVVLQSDDNADAANNLVTDDKNLYWTSLVGGGTIFRLPLAGGTLVPIADNIQVVDQGFRITATRGNVYFIGPPGPPQDLYQVSVNGGAVTTLAPMPGNAITSDDAAVYVGDYFSSQSISRIDLNTHAVTKLAQEPRDAILLVVQGNDLFWMNLDREIKSTAKNP